MSANKAGWPLAGQWGPDGGGGGSGEPLPAPAKDLSHRPETESWAPL